jgi:hypothetical protein
VRLAEDRRRPLTAGRAVIERLDAQGVRPVELPENDTDLPELGIAHTQLNWVADRVLQTRRAGFGRPSEGASGGCRIRQLAGWQPIAVRPYVHMDGAMTRSANVVRLRRV